MLEWLLAEALEGRLQNGRRKQKKVLLAVDCEGQLIP